MREIRPSGSEGGVRSIPHPYPYRCRLGARAATGGRFGGFSPNAEVMEKDYEFAPRAENITENGLAGAGSVTNVQIYRVNFTFSEMLPNYLPS